jgi:hypothetical protein
MLCIQTAFSGQIQPEKTSETNPKAIKPYDSPIEHASEISMRLARAVSVQIFIKKGLFWNTESKIFILFFASRLQVKNSAPDLLLLVVVVLVETFQLKRSGNGFEKSFCCAGCNILSGCFGTRRRSRRSEIPR